VDVPYRPKRLLLTYDDAGGKCARVVARMQRMLEDRAFVVTATPVSGAPTDLSGFDGVVLGTPLGLRGTGVSQALQDWVGRAEGLDERRVAIFSVSWGLGTSGLHDLRARLAELGVEVVAEHAYWLARPDDGNHLLPAECMIRIR